MKNQGLSRELRYEIYKAIKSCGNIWGDRDKIHEGISAVEFLNRIWDLRLMSSSDPRYDTAAEDAQKHLIDNDDWEDDYVFLDRFKLLDCKEEEFLKFLNVILSPDVRYDEEEIDKYIHTLEDLLPETYEIIAKTDKNGRTIHEVKAKNDNDLEDDNLYPVGLIPNDIPFIVDDDPSKFPSFQLISDFWDDYGFKTRFTLKYWRNIEDCVKLGYVKILIEKSVPGYTILPDSFLSLPTKYCSLGQDEAYYHKLERLFPGQQYQSILYALKDASWFPDIRYRFEVYSGFKNSIIRSATASDILASIKRKFLNGWGDSWDFIISCELPYSNKQLDLHFDFGNLEDKGNTNRIKALIGTNGAGKTSILKNLVKGLITNDESIFKPSQPIFSKVIAISFSIFDTFISLRGKSIVTYSYCGLHDKGNTIMSEEGRKDRLRESLIWINGGKQGHGVGNMRLKQRFSKGLEIVFPKEWVESIWIDDEIDIKAIIEKSKSMSTGESMILNLIASLYANIRQNSLIVFDEMEVHLHPKAIRQMMALLFKITREYKSACVLATHSSIVVQELLADNVIIIEKDENEVPISRILNHESLAENLSIISSEIFGVASIAPHYEKFIAEIATRSNSLDELLSKLSSRDLPPSLSLYMLARSIFDKSKEND